MTRVERRRQYIKDNPDKVKTNIRAIRNCGCTGVDFLSDDYITWLEQKLDIAENTIDLLYNELQDIKMNNGMKKAMINRLLDENTKLKHDAELKKAVDNIESEHYKQQLDVLKKEYEKLLLKVACEYALSDESQKELERDFFDEIIFYTKLTGKSWERLKDSKR